MTYTAEEIFSSPIFYLFIGLIAIFLIPLFIDLKKEINNMADFLARKKLGGKKRRKHLH
jgi:hypothetical protein